jgi:hypothetical protein
VMILQRKVYRKPIIAERSVKLVPGPRLHSYMAANPNSTHPGVTKHLLRIVQKRDNQLKPVASLSAEAFQGYVPSFATGHRPIPCMLKNTYADSCMIRFVDG